MLRKKIMYGLATAGLAALLWAGTGLGQEQKRPENPERTRPLAGGGQWDPERMHEMMITRVKEALKVDEEKWAAVKPQVERILALSQQVRTVGGMGWGMRGPVRRYGEELPPASSVEQAARELHRVLRDETAKPEDIAAKLAALRAARDKARQDLTKAQEALKALVDPRQEAQLVVMGLLD